MAEICCNCGKVIDKKDGGAAMLADGQTVCGSCAAKGGLRQCPCLFPMDGEPGEAG